MANLQLRLSRIAQAAISIVLAASCADVPVNPTKPAPLPRGGALHTTLPSLPTSSGFYLCEGDSIYCWDGAPPPQDASPATFSQVIVTPVAPEAFHEGKVTASGRFDAEFGKWMLHGTAKRDETVLADKVDGNDWDNENGCFVNGGIPGVGGTCRPGQRSFVLNMVGSMGCDVSMTGSGTLRAKKKFPFGYKVGVWKLTVNIPAPEWGEAPYQVDPITDPAGGCLSIDLLKTIGQGMTVTATTDCPSGAMWFTSSASVASINSSGVVTGVTIGDAQITARCGSKTGLATIKVVQSYEVGAPGGPTPPSESPGINCKWDSDVGYFTYQGKTYYFLINDWYRRCDGDLPLAALTAAPTRSVRFESVGSTPAWSNSTSVATTSGGVVTATGPGTTFIIKDVGSHLSATQVNVTHPSVPPSPAPSCCTYAWYHKDGSGMWTYEGTKVLAATVSPGASANLVSLNLATDALEPAQGPPAACQTASNVCWLAMQQFPIADPIDGTVNRPNEETNGGVLWYGGWCQNSPCPSAYPMHVVWRYNGVVVKDRYVTNDYGDYAPTVYMGGLQQYDHIVANVTVTDAKGTSITASTLILVDYIPALWDNRVRSNDKGGIPNDMKPGKKLGKGIPKLETVRPSPKEGQPLPPLPPLGKP